MPNSCSYLVPAALEQLQPQCLFCILWLEPAVAFILGWMERQGQNTSLPRKDAWMRIPSARRRIRHVQVEHAGMSTVIG